MRNWGVVTGLVLAILCCSVATPAASAITPHFSLRKLLDTVVTAPGTKVVSNAQSGTNVVAPGTQVISTKQGGTTVRAPFTNVDVSKDDGVHVKAPGTLVDLDPDGSGIIEFPGGSVNLGRRLALLLVESSQRLLLDTQVTAPDTTVNSGSSGTQVTAPGTEVNSVNGNTAVTAPGTVATSNGSGTKVRAPGTDVDVAPNGSGKVEFPGGAVNFGP